MRLAIDSPRNSRARYSLHLQQTNEEAKGGKEFVLMAGYPPSDLANNEIDKDTIEGCKLSGQAITVRWKS